MALSANAPLANRKKTKAIADSKLHVWTDVVAEVVRPMNIVFGFFIK